MLSKSIEDKRHALATRLISVSVYKIMPSRYRDDVEKMIVLGSRELIREREEKRSREFWEHVRANQADRLNRDSDE